MPGLPVDYYRRDWHFGPVPVPWFSPVDSPVSQRERGSNARQHRRIRRLRPVMLASCLSASFTPSTRDNFASCFFATVLEVRRFFFIIPVNSVCEGFFLRQAFCGRLWQTFVYYEIFVVSVFVNFPLQTSLVGSCGTRSFVVLSH